MPSDMRDEFNKTVKPAYKKTHAPICRRCGVYRPWGQYMHVHHIIPLLDGGTNDEDNLTVLCDGCHAEYHIGERPYKKWLDTPPGDLISWLLIRGDAEKAHYVIDHWHELRMVNIACNAVDYARDNDLGFRKIDEIRVEILKEEARE